jgi:SNF2 family DNA or RNA helicase
MLNAAASLPFIPDKTPSKLRTKIVETFQTDPSERIIVCKTKSASTGITLTAATTTVFVELPWTSSGLDQASCRNYRIGQESDVEVYILCGQDTMDQRMCEIIQKKQGYMDVVVDRQSENSMPLLDMFLEEMQKNEEIFARSAKMFCLFLEICKNISSI